MPIDTPRQRRHIVLTLVGGLIAFQALTPGVTLCFAPIGSPSTVAANLPRPPAPDAALQDTDVPEPPTLTLAQASPTLAQALALVNDETPAELAPEPSSAPNPALMTTSSEAVLAPGVAGSEQTTSEPPDHPAQPSELPVRSLYAGFPALRGLDPSTGSSAFNVPAFSSAEVAAPGAAPVVAPEPEIWALLATGVLGLAAARRRR